MSGCVNKVILIGRLGHDPSLRKSNDGKRIASFSMATDKSWRDKNTGERRSITTWHNVVCFNDGLAGVIEQFVKKGSHVYVEGEIGVRKYVGKDSVERTAVEIILPAFGGSLTLLDRREGRAPEAASYEDYGVGSPDKPPPGSGTDDEVQF